MCLRDDEEKKAKIMAAIFEALDIQSCYEFHHAQAERKMMDIVDQFVKDEPDVAARINIIQIAETYGYVGSEFRGNNYYPNDDACIHMLPYDCCPAGCGHN